MSYAASGQDSMQAVIFTGPLKVVVETRPVPQIEEPTDIIVKVQYTALELHVFRGHQQSPIGFIMGHEFTGEVFQTGSQVKTLNNGDRIVSPFTISCGDCFYCKRGYSSRCVEGKLFGSAVLDGGQAEYVRIPFADSTVVKAPAKIDERKLVLMADIFPTGYFAASNAFQGLDPASVKDSVAVVLGCGPVGLFALISVIEFGPKHVLAVDSVDSRLEQARMLGAEPWDFKTQEEGLKQRVLELTNNRGADVVVEVVGHSDALDLGFQLLRPWGSISSVGVHNGGIPWTGSQAYGKNLKFQMGRCPVRSIFEEALALFTKKQDLVDFMTEDIRPLSAAVQAYDDFNQMKSQKIIFEAQK